MALLLLVQSGGWLVAFELIATARARAAVLGLEIDYRVGDCERLELPDASFTRFPQRSGTCS